MRDTEENIPKKEGSLFAAVTARSYRVCFLFGGKGLVAWRIKQNRSFQKCFNIHTGNMLSRYLFFNLGV
jgi:hypothetical protein